MTPRLKTPPAAYPISLNEVKQHLNIFSGWTEDDDILKRLIVVATKRVEQFLRRRLITQTWYAYYDAWPKERYIVLPFGRLQTVTAIIYTDSSNTAITTFTDASTTTTDDYDVDINSDPGRIILEYGNSWPSSTLWPMNPIQIEFICGYGDDANNVEDMILHAIKIVVDDLYNHRGDIIIGVSTKNMMVVSDLLMPYRIHGEPTE